MANDNLESAVAAVVAAVRERGDAAVLEFTERWDGAELTPESLRVPAEAIARVDVETPFGRAFRRAAARIRRFHEAVKPRTVAIEDDDRVRMSLRWTAIEAVGLYIPGGKASYPSTLAMTAIPAMIAGVDRIVVVSPPGDDGEVSAEVLLAANILGLDEIYRVGGAQAVAALALGTETIPAVDKIFGPGNAFVAEAKKQLYGEVGIDLIAGPSELVVYADETAEPDWVAADMMAQAEHDESTCVTLLAASECVLAAVRQALERSLQRQARRSTIEASISANGRFEVVGTAVEAARRINEIAPEHLSIQIDAPEAFLPLIRNAGAIFLGAHSPVAVGDYYAGPNHVLPTGRTARFASCLSVEDFMKRSNVVSMDAGFLRHRCEDVEVLASGERLPAHAHSVSVRRRASVEFSLGQGLRRVTPYLLVDEDAAIKLNQNESPWDVPEEIKEEVTRRVRATPWHRYVQGLPEEFVAKLAQASGVDASCVLAASGSNLVLQWIFEAFGGPGKSFVAPSPSFSLYPLWAEVAGVRLQEVTLLGDLQYDVGSLLASISENRPALTVLCLPNNPTGTELSTDAVRRVAEAAAEVGGALVIDEAYREFSEPEFDRTPLVGEFDNVILVRTFSKAYASAGMRLGYALAPAPLATELRKMVPPFHLNLFAATLGSVLLENRDPFDVRVAEIRSERERVRAALDLLDGLATMPSHANFFLFKVARHDEVYDELAKRGILVRALGRHELLGGSLRVNVGTPEENDRLIAACQEILA